MAAKNRYHNNNIVFALSSTVNNKIIALMYGFASNRCKPLIVDAKYIIKKKKKDFVELFVGLYEVYMFFYNRLTFLQVCLFH